MTNAVDRVSLNTSFEVNARIEEQTERNIAYYATHLEEIDTRLEKLNREWDIERILEAHVATVSIASIIFGTIGSRRWLYLPAVIGGFLLNHAVNGWTPQLPVLRRLGVRTQMEIERERYALKALRGDFKQIGGGTNEDNANEDKASRTGNITKISQRVLEAVK